MFNPLTAEGALRALIEFALSNARRFYSSMGNPLAGKGLKPFQDILNRHPQIENQRASFTFKISQQKTLTPIFSNVITKKNQVVKQGFMLSCSSHSEPDSTKAFLQTSN